eukprot:gene13399-9222_t
MPMERDRSDELYNLFQLHKSQTLYGHRESRESLHSTNEVRTFSRFAQAFSRDIANVSTMIYRLAELNNRQNIFEDQTTEISGLTQIVKTTLQKLHKDLDTLEQLKSVAVTSQKMSYSRGPSRESYTSTGQSAARHSETVVQSLKTKLAKTGQDFRSALQEQTQNMKSNSTRRNLFSSADQPQTLESALFQDMEQYQQQQQLVSGNVQYARQRMEDVMQIEAAVTEVNELFNDFTRLVREQDDVVIRIDANVDDALRNVNAGSNELLRYLAHLTTNRSLIMKVLGRAIITVDSFLMSKLSSSQELLLHQINAEYFPYPGSRIIHLQAPGGASTINSGAILTPEIRRRSEWLSSLDIVPVSAVPRCIQSSSLETSRQKEIHYIADSFDREWLKSYSDSKAGASQNSSGSAESTKSNNVLDISILEKLITAWELEAYNNPDIDLESIDTGTVSIDASDKIKEEAKDYWIRKRRALGGNIPCIASLRISVEDDNQGSLNRSDVLGDCPIPFKQRDWVSSIILRSPENDSHSIRRKRLRSSSHDNSSGYLISRAALKLSAHLFLREQLLVQHTFTSLYELSYLRETSSRLNNPNAFWMSTEKIQVFSGVDQIFFTLSKVILSINKAFLLVIIMISLIMSFATQRYFLVGEKKSNDRDTRIHSYHIILMIPQSRNIPTPSMAQSPHFRPSNFSDRTVGIFEVSGGSVSRRQAALIGHQAPVWMVAWANPRFGKVIASAGYDRRAIIWKEKSNGQWIAVHVIDIHHGSVNAVHWAPYQFGAILASASSDGTLAVTSFDNGCWQESETISNNVNHIAHAMGTTSVSFAPFLVDHPEVLLVASGGCDRQVRIWHAVKNDGMKMHFTILDTLGNHSDRISDVSFSPSCGESKYALLAVAYGSVIVVYRKSWEELLQQSGVTSSVLWESSCVSLNPIWRLSWSPCGELLVATTTTSEVNILREGPVFTDPWIFQQVSLHPKHNEIGQSVQKQPLVCLRFFASYSCLFLFYFYQSIHISCLRDCFLVFLFVSFSFSYYWSFSESFPFLFVCFTFISDHFLKHFFNIFFDLLFSTFIFHFPALSITFFYFEFSINLLKLFFAITEDCVEPTDGWVNREGKPLLTVCFMHSFGKCTGRTDFNPRTCFQIHLNSVVLNSLRRHYSNPTRKFFSRTVKATIGPELRQQLSAVARKALKVQYLEYRVQDVYNTLGFMRYEAAYRQWLFGESSHQKEAFPAVSSEQCSLFAEAGSCPSGRHCPFIHASPHNALVRDQVLSQALRRFCAPVGSGSDSSGSEKTKDPSDTTLPDGVSSTGTCLPITKGARPSMDMDWSQCPRPHLKLSPIPVYTVEQKEGSSVVGARQHATLSAITFFIYTLQHSLYFKPVLYIYIYIYIYIRLNESIISVPYFVPKLFLKKNDLSPRVSSGNTNSCTLKLSFDVMAIFYMLLFRFLSFICYFLVLYLLESENVHLYNLNKLHFSAVQYVSFTDIEPTAGWLGDRNRSSLDICFMHSFGKCTGKTRDKHPTTCHQIHVKREVLDAVRQTYALPQRRYFCRTMKANITENKAFSLQYLEFKTEDIDVTAGSTAYEVEYRRWLTNDVVIPLVKDEKSPQTENYISTTNLCWEFAVTGRCPKGASCQDIHGLLVNSLSKHRYVKMALKEINRNDEISTESSRGLPSPLPRHQDTVPKMYPTQPQFYLAPQYYTVPNSQATFGCQNTPLNNTPVQAMPVASPGAPLLTTNPQNSLVYVLIEGPDNILRIVPLTSMYEVTTECMRNIYIYIYIYIISCCALRFRLHRTSIIFLLSYFASSSWHIIQTTLYYRSLNKTENCQQAFFKHDVSFMTLLIFPFLSRDIRAGGIFNCYLRNERSGWLEVEQQNDYFIITYMQQRSFSFSLNVVFTFSLLLWLQAEWEENSTTSTTLHPADYFISFKEGTMVVGIIGSRLQHIKYLFHVFIHFYYLFDHIYASMTLTSNYRYVERMEAVAGGSSKGESNRKEKTGKENGARKSRMPPWMSEPGAPPRPDFSKYSKELTDLYFEKNAILDKIKTLQSSVKRGGEADDRRAEREALRTKLNDIDSERKSERAKRYKKNEEITALRKQRREKGDQVRALQSQLALFTSPAELDAAIEYMKRKMESTPGGLEAEKKNNRCLRELEAAKGIFRLLHPLTEAIEKSEESEMMLEQEIREIHEKIEILNKRYNELMVEKKVIDSHANESSSERAEVYKKCDELRARLNVVLDTIKSIKAEKQDKMDEWDKWCQTAKAAYEEKRKAEENQRKEALLASEKILQSALLEEKKKRAIERQNPYATEIRNCDTLVVYIENKQIVVAREEEKRAKALAAQSFDPQSAVPDGCIVLCEGKSPATVAKKAKKVVIRHDPDIIQLFRSVGIDPPKESSKFVMCIEELRNKKKEYETHIKEGEPVLSSDDDDEPNVDDTAVKGHSTVTKNAGTVMNRTAVLRIGSPTYGRWPWPAKLPLKEKWYHRLTGGRSVADENRTYNVVGDVLLCSVITYSAYRAYVLTRNNAYQTHYCHLNNHPPAIIANDFDFTNEKNNRTISRQQLQDYRDKAVRCKKECVPVESIIFNNPQPLKLRIPTIILLQYIPVSSQEKMLTYPNPNLIEFVTSLLNTCFLISTVFILFFSLTLFDLIQVHTSSFLVRVDSHLKLCSRHSILLALLYLFIAYKYFFCEIEWNDKQCQSPDVVDAAFLTFAFAIVLRYGSRCFFLSTRVSQKVLSMTTNTAISQNGFDASVTSMAHGGAFGASLVRYQAGMSNTVRYGDDDAHDRLPGGFTNTETVESRHVHPESKELFKMCGGKLNFIRKIPIFGEPIECYGLKLVFTINTVEFFVKGLGNGFLATSFFNIQEERAAKREEPIYLQDLGDDIALPVGAEKDAENNRHNGIITVKKHETPSLAFFLLGEFCSFSFLIHSVWVALFFFI